MTHSVMLMDTPSFKQYVPYSQMAEVGVMLHNSLVTNIIQYFFQLIDNHSTYQINTIMSDLLFNKTSLVYIKEHT